MVEQSGSPSADGDGKVLSENNMCDEREQSEVLQTILQKVQVQKVMLLKLTIMMTLERFL